MFIRKKRSPHNKEKYSIQIVESVRKWDKVSQVILRHVGTAIGEEELADMMAIAKNIKTRLEEDRQPSLPLFSPEDLVAKRVISQEPIHVDLTQLREEQRFNEGIPDVFGALYNELGFDTIFKGRFGLINNSILKSCVLARLANPSSKLRTSELLEDDFAIKLPVDKIYRMMGQLEKQTEVLQNKVKSSTLNLLDQKVEVLLYDVTTLYFESFTKDELRNNGFSKDCKFKETQLVMALITTPKGLPIAYKVFPGNTQETKTLIPTIDELKKEFTVETIDFAADRGMFSESNLKELEKHKINYVVAAKLKTMSRKDKESILEIKKNVSENDVFRTMNLKHKGRRLVVCYSPQRAYKDLKDRERLVERVKKIADKEGNIEIKKLVNNNGTKKYLKFKDKQKKVASINEDKIEQESLWDGVYGYITNSNGSDEEVISRYKKLWEIEESFRINKHDLKLRPIFHRKENKIKAHLDICFLTYALARQLSYRYEVQQGDRLSFRVARNELLKVQASVLINKSNKESYVLPSKSSVLAKKLYQVVGLKRSATPYRLPKK